MKKTRKVNQTSSTSGSIPSPESTPATFGLEEVLDELEAIVTGAVVERRKAATTGEGKVPRREAGVDRNVKAQRDKEITAGDSKTQRRKETIAGGAKARRRKREATKA